jgi:GT2 family glycosyltransferase
VNPVLILTHNGLPLTVRCVESIRKQNCETRVCIIDNGSKDGTVPWAEENGYLLDASPLNAGVSAGWNHGLNRIFEKHPKCLVVGSDTWLPPWFYRELAAYGFLNDVGFVTGVAVDNMEQAMQPPSYGPLTDNPDFSAFMISRSTWEKIGPFDERMRLYASDCDLHIRAHRMGIRLCKAGCAFYHERSSTLRLAPEAERIEIQAQANSDRATFRSIYGCLPGDETYEAIFR